MLSGGGGIKAEKQSVACAGMEQRSSAPCMACSSHPGEHRFEVPGRDEHAHSSNPSGYL